MRRVWIGAFAVLILLAAVPGPALAQDRTCRQVLPADFRRIVNAQGQEVLYFRDPVRVLCTGGLRLEADSAVMNRTAASVVLVGGVVFEDSVRRLESDWANYLGRVDQLLARGSVVVTDLQDGAVVTGDELNYLRETETRPGDRAIVTGTRPHAVIPPSAAEPTGAVEEDAATTGTDPATRPSDPQREPVAPSSDTVATQVWANRMELLGQDFLALGDVEIERGDIVGASDTARFSRAPQQMTLLGTAHVQNPEYRLEGDRIDAALAGDVLTEVFSHGSARVRAEDLTVRAERVRIGFADGEVERLEAWNPDPGAAPRRATADAEGFGLRADSIDALADSLGIREVRAVGRAYGERAADPGSMAPALIARDWIQGDTILGFFERPAAGPGAAEGEEGLGDPEPGIEGEDGEEVAAVLERIEVAGGSGDALSLYRMSSEEEGQRRSINFMKASRIILFMEAGDVARVEAVGPIEGLYLDPVTGRPTEEAGGAGSEPQSEVGR